MIRKLSRLALAFSILSMTVGAVAARQPMAVPDKIIVRSTKKDGATVTHEGRLKLTPAGLKVMVGDKFETDGGTISYADIIRHEPGDMPGVNRDEMLGQIRLENNKTKKDYETAKGVYVEMLKKSGKAPPPSRRHLEFRGAMMSTKIADESGDDEKWKELAELAVKEWGGFLTEYASGWEVWPAARTQARLLIELNKFDDAAKVWSRLVKNPELPADLKLEAGIQEVDSHFRARAFQAAASLASSLGSAAGPGAAKDKLAIYELAAKAGESGLKGDAIKPVAAEVEKKIAETKDPAIRAVGFSVLGELYLFAGKPRDAMWTFLWVETVYNSDKDEVLKAMSRLVEALRAQMDEDQEKRTRERIRRFRATF